MITGFPPVRLYLTGNIAYWKPFKKKKESVVSQIKIMR